MRLQADFPGSTGVGWYRVRSRVCRSKIIRVRPDGSDPKAVVDQPAYGFAQINVLRDDRTVVFTEVPNEWNLWRHRNLGLTLKKVRKDGPVRMNIEIATIGHQPRVLIPDAHLPVVQPIRSMGHFEVGG